MTGLVAADQVHRHHRPDRRRSPRRPPAPPIANGATVTVTGTATDVGGGVVAGVEVSTDGGATWHPATGHHRRGPTPTSSTASAATPIKVRAIDDSANIGAAADARRSPSTCPCSVFGDGRARRRRRPPTPRAVELGLRFTPPTDGFVTGVRFYKGTGNTGTHIGSPVERRRPAPRAP